MIYLVLGSGHTALRVHCCWGSTVIPNVRSPLQYVYNGVQTTNHSVPRCSQSEHFDFGRLQPSTRSIESHDERRGWMAQYSQLSVSTPVKMPGLFAVEQCDTINTRTKIEPYQPMRGMDNRSGEPIPQ